MAWHNRGFAFNNWIDRLKRSKKGVLKDHLFLGTSTWTGEPILLPDSIMSEHLWYTGGSGSGKSASQLAPLAAQVIEKGDRSLVFIDQKGDLPSFWNCCDLAHANGLPFKYFSIVPGHESFIFNPLRQEFLSRLTALQKTELFTQSAGIDFGEGHGPSFFMGKTELAYLSYISHYKEPPLDNYATFYKLFNDKSSFAAIGHASDWDDASQLRPLFARLGSMSAANATPSNCPKAKALQAAMDVLEPLRAPTVYYFNLPASMGRNAARFVARSVLQNLFAAAGLRNEKESTPVVVICDEFQESVGLSVGLLLEQGRSRGLTFVLAHQSIEQLKRNATDLLPTLQSCTSTHVILEATDEASVKYVQMRSGEAVYGLTSWSQPAPCDESPKGLFAELLAPWKAVSSDGLSPALMNVREELRPRVDANLVTRISADPTAAFVAIKKNKGLANFDGFMVPMRSYFHISPKLFTARNAEPWPTWDRPETVIVEMTNPLAPTLPKSPAPATETDLKIVPPPSIVDASLIERLNAHKRGNRPNRNGGGHD